MIGEYRLTFFINFGVSLDMEYLFEFIAGTSLFGLFIATYLKEFLKSESFSQKFPFINCLLPSWSFFAPTPYSSDYFLLYRFIYEDNHIGKWQQANRILENRPYYSFLWNPENRFLKGFVDVILDLVKCIHAVKDKNQICMSIPYLHLLNFINSFSRDPSTVKVQFVVMSQTKLDEAKLIFLSETHPVKKYANIP